MDESKAVAILSALANGVNPLTGEVFPEHSPYQSAEVVRALYVACRKLEGATRSVERSKSNAPSNAGKPWKEVEDRQLLAAHDSGKSVSEIAELLARTAAGIQARLEKHGRLPPSTNGAGVSRWRGRTHPVTS